MFVSPQRLCAVAVVVMAVLCGTHGCQRGGAPGADRRVLSSFDVEAMATKTGTTIVGLCCSDGVVLGADTRSTSGSLVMNKQTLKIHPIARRIFACGAGTSADCEQITRRAKLAQDQQEIEFDLSGESERLSSVGTAVQAILSHLWSRSGRQASAVFLVGGVDEQGPKLYQIDGDAFPVRCAFGSLGSGSADALAVLESACRGFLACPVHFSEEFVNVTTAQGTDIVRRAVRAGILNDLGSGSHVDLCIITNDRVASWRERIVSSWESDRPASVSSQFADDVLVPSQSVEGTDADLSRTTAPVLDDGALGRKVWSRWRSVRRLVRGRFEERTERLDSRSTPVEVHKF